MDLPVGHEHVSNLTKRSAASLHVKCGHLQVTQFMAPKDGPIGICIRTL